MDIITRKEELNLESDGNQLGAAKEAYDLWIECTDIGVNFITWWGRGWQGEEIFSPDETGLWKWWIIYASFILKEHEQARREAIKKYQTSSGTTWMESHQQAETFQKDVLKNIALEII